ncbi:unnamed protein product [Protopolystoma xenopodis]|uniref:Uncharacterized protein n=1 Tax=Protopolystoma xenopodis TaxID=117903 RepID=A0A3S5CVD8_9PLAT|nr:unnamed protein product [Protopolystoma xenopodis]
MVRERDQANRRSCLALVKQLDDMGRKTEMKTSWPESMECALLSRMAPWTWYIRRQLAGIVIDIVSASCRSQRQPQLQPAKGTSQLSVGQS